MPGQNLSILSLANSLNSKALPADGSKAGSPSNPASLPFPARYRIGTGFDNTHQPTQQTGMNPGHATHVFHQMLLEGRDWTATDK